MTRFTQLNADWNADPNAPEPRINVDGRDLVLAFSVNAFKSPRFMEGDLVTLRFISYGRFRLGATNDEGWYQGQCRFSDSAPGWGEFYEVTGELELLQQPDDWHLAPDVQNDSAKRHFLFYFKDATFECTASGMELRLPDNSASLEVQASDSA